MAVKYYDKKHNIFECTHEDCKNIWKGNRRTAGKLPLTCPKCHRPSKHMRDALKKKKK